MLPTRIDEDVRYYTEEQVEQIGEWLDSRMSSWYLDAFKFSLGTGIRQESLITANVNNVTLEKVGDNNIFMLKVTEKGRKTRWVPMLYEAPGVFLRRKDIIKDSQEVRRMVNLTVPHVKRHHLYEERAKEGFLFFEIRTASPIQHLAGRWRKDLPGLEGLNWHSLRHTFAIRGLRDNIPLELISKILGHTDSNFTQRVYQRFIDPRTLAQSLAGINQKFLQEIPDELFTDRLHHSKQ